MQHFDGVENDEGAKPCLAPSVGLPGYIIVPADRASSGARHSVIGSP